VDRGQQAATDSLNRLARQLARPPYDRARLGPSTGESIWQRASNIGRATSNHPGGVEGHPLLNLCKIWLTRCLDALNQSDSNKAARHVIDKHY
jgi:hypothetical protein